MNDNASPSLEISLGKSIKSDAESTPATGRISTKDPLYCAHAIPFDGTFEAAMQTEVSALKSEMNRIAETTSFGGINLLNGQFGNRSFQVGASV